MARRRFREVENPERRIEDIEKGLNGQSSTNNYQNNGSLTLEEFDRLLDEDNEYDYNSDGYDEMMADDEDGERENKPNERKSDSRTDNQAIDIQKENMKIARLEEEKEATYRMVQDYMEKGIGIDALGSLQVIALYEYQQRISELKIEILKTGDKDLIEKINKFMQKGERSSFIGQRVGELQQEMSQKPKKINSHTQNGIKNVATKQSLGDDEKTEDYSNSDKDDKENVEESKEAVAVENKADERKEDSKSETPIEIERKKLKKAQEELKVAEENGDDYGILEAKQTIAVQEENIKIARLEEEKTETYKMAQENIQQGNGIDALDNLRTIALYDYNQKVSELNRERSEWIFERGKLFTELSGNDYNDEIIQKQIDACKIAIKNVEEKIANFTQNRSLYIQQRVSELQQEMRQEPAQEELRKDDTSIEPASAHQAFVNELSGNGQYHTYGENAKAITVPTKDEQTTQREDEEQEL